MSYAYNQITPIYSPISAKGGKRRSRTQARRTRKPKRSNKSRTRRRRTR